MSVDSDRRDGGCGAPGAGTWARSWLFATTVTALYAAIVITVSVYHEPWRDEVVPLSIARSAPSMAEMAAALKFEGHPILWYVVVREAYTLVGQTWALKAASLACAIGAIFLFMLSPLPWWLRCLFTFSLFPLWQYSVVNRGYGLEMLLLFAFCGLYPRRREHPLRLGLVLAALANTELLGFIIAVAGAAAAVVDGWLNGTGWRRRVRDPWLVLAAAVCVAGLALAFAIGFPDSGHTGPRIRTLDLRRLAAGVGHALVQPAAHAGGLSILPAPSAWVWAYFVYLTRRPAVLCFGAVALIGIEASFQLVWGPAPWHLGNILLVILATLWLAASAPDLNPVASPRLERARTWLGRILAGGGALLLTQQLLMGLFMVTLDLRQDYSSSPHLAQALRSDPALADAVVIGEPDSWITSLPYYADNRIYLPRERVYRAWGRYTAARQSAYDLDALLATAREVRDRCGCPVVIVLGWEVDKPGVRTLYGGSPYEETFAITPEARDAFLAATRRVANLRGPTITDEKYDVYVLR